eukprot:CAMPEP_0198498746 /NCGR_PEP_ID=MMETSP1462-20131121/7198_1 /TAXON_ID=1333877 /ORGANISM="Brandtodinium nutriculum, Strain RCC3387" /LENGTH=114 /DNA_ID=CAMNT_0044227687 /DNA_START=167 /DNA_END=509 /DNA_ORIENTATION=+
MRRGFPSGPPVQACAARPASAKCSGSKASDWWPTGDTPDRASSKDLFPHGTPRKIVMPDGVRHGVAEPLLVQVALILVACEEAMGVHGVRPAFGVVVAKLRALPNGPLSTRVAR